MRAIQAGVGYFCLVFAAGFLLGTVRTFLVVPRLGELAAVFLELPIILVLSWMASRWMAQKFNVPEETSARMLMGTVAFVLLICAELALSVVGFGRSVAAHFGTYSTLPGFVGLLGQLLFASFPLLQIHASNSRHVFGRDVGN